MKKFLVIFFIFLFSALNAGNASSINPALYQAMTNRSYRNNYNRQVNNRVMPYWQAQANYSTRGKIYQNYSSYNNYLYRHNTSVNYNRGQR